MEDNLDNQFINSQITISDRSKHYLLYTAKWANFLAIIGIIFMSLMAIGAVFMLISAAMVPGMGFMALAYIAMIVVYIFPIIYMINFSRNMKQAVSSDDPISAEKGFEYLKSLFKFAGIFTIVFISIYILVIIFGLGAASLLR